MFRFVALIFLFLTSLIDGQFLSITFNHFNNTDFSPISANVTGGDVINKTKSDYEPRIHYQYTLNNKIYENDVINMSGIHYNNLAQAQLFLNNYTMNQNITVYYNPNNPNESVMFKGLDDKDTSSLLSILPINLATFLVLILAFFYRWNFDDNNVPMNSVIYGIWGIFLTSILGSLVLIFYFKLSLSGIMQFNFLMSYLLVGIGFFIYRFASFSSGHKKHKYKRLYKTKEYEMLADDGKQFTNPFFSMKQRDILPLLMINALVIMALISYWSLHQFSIGYLTYIMIFLTLIFNIVYILNASKKYRNIGNKHSITSLH